MHLSVCISSLITLPSVLFRWTTTSKGRREKFSCLILYTVWAFSNDRHPMALCFLLFSKFLQFYKAQCWIVFCSMFCSFHEMFEFQRAFQSQSPLVVSCHLEKGLPDDADRYSVLPCFKSYHASSCIFLTILPLSVIS